VPVLWSCELALVPPLVDELPLVCACASTAPNIAIATEAPSRPFSNLFIFMSLSYLVWGKTLNDIKKIN